MWASYFWPMPRQKKRTRETRKDGDAAEDEAQQVVVSIPVLVNADLVKEGEELRVHRTLAAKKQRPAEAITMAKLTKMKGSQRGAFVCGKSKGLSLAV